MLIHEQLAVSANLLASYPHPTVHYCAHSNLSALAETVIQLLHEERPVITAALALSSSSKVVCSCPSDVSYSESFISGVISDSDSSSISLPLQTKTKKTTHLTRTLLSFAKLFQIPYLPNPASQPRSFLHLTHILVLLLMLQSLLYAHELLDETLPDLCTSLKSDVRKLLNDPSKSRIPLFVCTFFGYHLPNM